MNYSGIPVSGGVVIGRVFRYVPSIPEAERRSIEPGATHEAVLRFEEAKRSASGELEAIRVAMEREDPEKAKIFTAHADILYDPAIDEEVREKIEDELMNTEWAVEKVFKKYARLMERTNDELLRERAADIRDVKLRLLRNLAGLSEVGLSRLPGRVVVVAHDLFPSDTASLDREMVLGIVTEVGGITSHTAIIARSYGIPALLGVEGALAHLADGSEVVLDAIDGTLTADPTPVLKEAARAKAAAHAERQTLIARFLDREPVTADGVRIMVDLNIGSADAEELKFAEHMDGVGLFRTEFLYMAGESLPAEEEQYKAYRRVLLRFGERPVILRTLDIGGDKQLAALPLPTEQNPFLGNRALRLCFSEPELFHTQLRAALRASVYGNLRLMFPMVGSIEDLRRAKKAVGRAMVELDAEGVAYDRDIKQGIMVEIPSVAVIADLIAEEADFASIGTNDLCQYTLAVDRMNPAVADYYASYHPAMFRLIRQVTEAFDRAGKAVSVCGEMGGDPMALPALLGLGLRKLSMNAGAVAECKKVITLLDTGEAKAMAERACHMHTAQEVESLLRAHYERGGV